MRRFAVKFFLYRKRNGYVLGEADQDAAPDGWVDGPIFGVVTDPIVEPSNPNERFVSIDSDAVATLRQGTQEELDGVQAASNADQITIDRTRARDAIASPVMRKLLISVVKTMLAGENEIRQQLGMAQRSFATVRNEILSRIDLEG